ncbi:hypothetical protein [Corynebacterium cystitidis]|uniref:DUF2335 domain-containing protein n=1 Tax=Corynebacterium cystitidis DSM 20524 TaxID=1121357 RepID=A0A1H9WJX7_9CORY|nr:hypothetical protein [Corynebacterium cystitidis]WJY81360.1 hypothetical protein CCYS_01935 [Corynebacterium cystitidis DSM 20524]SES33967.1 hypothetical protein SAMN05661109_02767 [Corynebacterium cystitidis DSM 20524]SNV88114.1 Uncharacterised protein [Corynebacterium cystitidis]
MTSDNPERTSSTDSEMAGNSRGNSFPIRHGGNLDDGRDSQTDASTEAGREFERDPVEGFDLDKARQDPVLLAKISAYLQENHLHLPVLTPDQATMAKMREETPELYEFYIDSMKKGVQADYIQRTYPYTEPLKNANAGRRYGLVAVIGVLIIAGYALYLDHPWFAGVITAIDIIGLAAIFSNSPRSSEKPKNTGES